MVKILFIYADDCKHCQASLMVLESAVQECKKTCEILKFLYNSREAVSIAINKGVTDLPFCVINGKLFGKNEFVKKELVKAIKNAKC